jgi:hypothetical protein
MKDVFLNFFEDVSFLGYTFGAIVIRMDVRILQISQIGTDFCQKKSVPICEICKIRTSIRITICNLLFASNEISKKNFKKHVLHS